MRPSLLHRFFEEVQQNDSLYQQSQQYYYAKKLELLMIFCYKLYHKTLVAYLAVQILISKGRPLIDPGDMLQ